MTCKDCIHYNEKSFNLCKKWILPLERDEKICKYFVNSDGTYHDGQWHCDRCGKPISHFGLCDECDRWLEHAVIGAKRVHEDAVKHIHYDSQESE